MRPVIDLLREAVELDPGLAAACGDECDPVNDPNACLASQVAWALEHGPGYDAPAPVHVHAWQPGPVVMWSLNYAGGAALQWENGDVLALACGCGTVRLVSVAQARTDVITGRGPVDVAP